MTVTVYRGSESIMIAQVCVEPECVFYYCGRALFTMTVCVLSVNFQGHCHRDRAEPLRLTLAGLRLRLLQDESRPLI